MADRPLKLRFHATSRVHGRCPRCYPEAFCPPLREQEHNEEQQRFWRERQVQGSSNVPHDHVFSQSAGKCMWPGCTATHAGSGRGGAMGACDDCHHEPDDSRVTVICECPCHGRTTGTILRYADRDDEERRTGFRHRLAGE